MLARAALPLNAFLPLQWIAWNADLSARPRQSSRVLTYTPPCQVCQRRANQRPARLHIRAPGAVLRELLLVSPAEGASSSTQPSSQPFAQQHRPPASAFAEQEAVEREEQATGSTETSTPARRPLWAKRAPPPTATRTRPQPLGIARAAFYEHPGRTASGEKYNPDGLTAAHKTLPLGTRLRVVNQRNGRSVVVRINDRVPRQAKFPIDLSRGSARAIGMSSVAPVILYAMR
jgi:rare lipoprotein A